jgi:diguanylate cyclase (GGDEF)-like protein/PAS domain S-box-containing protein
MKLFDRRWLTPFTLIFAFSCLLIVCVVGLLAWKALEARTNALAQNQLDLRNLAHSMAEHSFQTFQNVDLVLGSVTDRALYDPPPTPENMNRYLRLRRQGLPQVSEFGVLDLAGNWKYSSLAKLPESNASTDTFFQIHQDIEDSAVQISAPFHFRDSERWTVIVSRRIDDRAGQFAGVAFAAIDLRYFSEYYRTFEVGRHTSISLLRTDGRMLASSISPNIGADLSGAELFQSGIAASAQGTYRLVSPLDGQTKALAYERTPNYATVVTVAEAEREVLANWRRDVRSDAILAIGFLATVILGATALAAQFKKRSRAEGQLREREARYRILAENAGDIVLQFEPDGSFKYASPAAERVLGWTEASLLGRRCVELVHVEDRALVEQTFDELAHASSERTLTYRMQKSDLSYAWVETLFRRVSADAGSAPEIVAGLRNVTRRKELEEELREVNRKLASLATTDGLTGLSNRRAFDQLLRQHGHDGNLTLMMIDVDHFKLFNDSFGHVKGDECLREVARVIGEQVRDANGFPARYGGEEFAVVLPQTGEDAAAGVAAAIHGNIARLAIAHPASGTAYITLSIGIAHKASESTDIWEVVRDSDLALYRAKRLGRNRTVLASAIAADTFDVAPAIAVS